MDPVEVGNRIRTLRKQKGITLEKLTDLFSLGKLSNIEKGKIPVDVDDIKLICERLGVPLEDVLDEHKDRIIHFINNELQRARGFITMGLGESGKKILLSVSKEAKKQDLKHLRAEINFYWGVYHYKIKNNFRVATAYFERVIFDNQKHQHVAVFKLRAYNALSCLQNDLGKLSSSLKYNNDALQFIQNNHVDSIDDEVNVLFNKSVFNVFLGDYNLATSYANNALKNAQGSPRYKIVFLISIIQILRGDWIAAEVNLKSAMDFFLRENDIPFLMRAFQAQYYLYSKNPEKYQADLETTETRSSKEILRKANSETASWIIEALQMLAENTIKTERYEVAQNLIQNCENLIPLIPKDKVHYKTFYLMAKLIEKTINNKSLIEHYLKKSLTYLEDDESAETAIIMHDLAVLLNEENGFFKKSSEIFYRLYHREYYDLAALKHVIPEPRF